MKKIHLTLFLFFTCSIVSFSQKHGAKINVLGLGYGNLGLNYEYVINDASSIQASFSYLVPRTGFEALTPTTNTNVTYEQNELTGYSASLEYRMYSKQSGPKGFYVGPWFRYSNRTFNLNYLENNYTYDYKAGGTSVSLGFELGTQFLIADHIAIDLTFLGIGAARNNIFLNLETDDFTKTEASYENEFKDIPVLGDKIDVIKTGDGKFEMDLPFYYVTWRSAFRIGYFF